MFSRLPASRCAFSAIANGIDGREKRCKTSTKVECLFIVTTVLYHAICIRVWYWHGTYDTCIYAVYHTRIYSNYNKYIIMLTVYRLVEAR